MQKYVLFDLDGTLTDPVEGITNSVKYALKHFGIIENDMGKLKMFIGPPLIRAFTEYCGLSETDAKRALGEFRVYFENKGINENRLFDGTKDMLCELKKNGYFLAVASSKPEIYVKKILANFEIDRFFDFVGGSDMAETRADKCSVIEYCLKSIGSPDPSDCLMIGDRSHDVDGARQNGLCCIGVLFGCGTREELEHSGAAALARDMNELKDLVFRFFDR